MWFIFLGSYFLAVSLLVFIVVSEFFIILIICRIYEVTLRRDVSIF